jgi:hypothetical protein
MRLPLGIVVGLFLAGLAYVAYQRPEIRVLFEPSTTPENPLEFLERLPEVRAPEASPPDADATRPAGDRSGAEAASPPEPDRPIPEAVNQIPNEEVSRVLMQILAARNLARSISISVTDREVAISGEVNSPEERVQILDIVERGREARRINSENLVLRRGD